MDTARYLTSDRHAKSGMNLTVLYRDMMTWTSHTVAIRISSRFDTDAVIIAGSLAILHQHMITGIDINSIGAWTALSTSRNLDSIHMDLAAIADMHIPEAGLSHSHNHRPSEVLSHHTLFACRPSGLRPSIYSTSTRPDHRSCQDR